MVMRSSRDNQFRKFDPDSLTTRDVLVIVPIVVSFLAISIVFAFSVTHEVYIKWGGLALDTTVLYGLFVNYSRALFRNWRFWAMTAFALVVHLCGFAIVFNQVDEWRLSWFTVMAVEYPFLILLRDRLCPK